jgi:hypothetical protein
MRCLLGILVLAAAIGLAGCGGDDGTTSDGGGVVAAFDVSPATGTSITDFNFDASASAFSTVGYEYRWDWENDGSWDTDWSTSATVTHRYSFWEGDDFDTVEVKLEVRKGSGSDTALDTLVLDTRHGHVLDEFNLIGGPQNPMGLGSDGTDLWVSDWGAPGTGRLYKYSPITSDSLYSLRGPDTWPGGIEWDGEYLCVTGYLKIRRVNQATGAVVNEFDVVYSSGGSGLAWDGEVFYFPSRHSGSGGDGKIHKYAADGSHLGSYDSPRGSLYPTGLGYDGRHLWAKVAGIDTLFVLDPEDGDILGLVPILEGAWDVAFIDGYLWVLGKTGGYKLSRVVP